MLHKRAPTKKKSPMRARWKENRSTNLLTARRNKRKKNNRTDRTASSGAGARARITNTHKNWTTFLQLPWAFCTLAYRFKLEPSATVIWFCLTIFLCQFLLNSTRAPNKSSWLWLFPVNILLEFKPSKWTHTHIKPNTKQTILHFQEENHKTVMIFPFALCLSQRDVFETYFYWLSFCSLVRFFVVVVVRYLYGATHTKNTAWFWIRA